MTTASHGLAPSSDPTQVADVNSKRAAALIIGNELLSGKIAEGNLLVLARTLRGLGIVLERVVMVLDDRARIAAEVRSLAASHDVVFTSGGVGPTHDDQTIDAVADAFGTRAVTFPELEAMIRGYYGEAITEGHLLMARAPEGSRLVSVPEMPWPTVIKENVWVLPGVPQIFAMKMPVVVAELGGGVRFVSHAVYTSLDEGPLKPLLDAVVAAHPAVEVGSYPKWREPRYRTKVTFDGQDEAAVLEARDAFVATLPLGARVDLVDE
ncbi:MAG: competence/damage-inducible protein A [Deltaproteobacteria bacterium]|nr:competence/damage-inducible protein A [Deltaproteobacteria bacterium]